MIKIEEQDLKDIIIKWYNEEISCTDIEKKKESMAKLFVRIKEGSKND
jgi:hypothetical protein